MKTSILISSVAALCLLVTFAEAPRRHGEDKMNSSSTDNISIAVMSRPTMLPGVVITADKKKEAGISVPDIPAEDFSYLKFDVSEYTKDEAVNLDEVEMLPEATETEFSYLKFNVSDYITDSELSVGEIAELPVYENNTVYNSTPEPSISEFEYLRFDVIEYISNSGTEATGIGELPIEEIQALNQAEITPSGETINEFGYLKFDASKYYSSANMSSEEFELPE